MNIKRTAKKIGNGIVAAGVGISTFVGLSTAAVVGIGAKVASDERIETKRKVGLFKKETVILDGFGREIDPTTNKRIKK